MRDSDERDRSAFDDFVRAEIKALIRVAYLLTGDSYHAEDLVQMALVKVATHWQRIEDPAAYARRVVYTQSASWWRHRHRRIVEFVTPQVPDRPAPEPPELEVAMVLRAALSRLTARQRAVLVLRFYEDCSEAETAARLNCRVGTVKSQTRHALNRLRKIAPELTDISNRPGSARVERSVVHQ